MNLISTCFELLLLTKKFLNGLLFPICLHSQNASLNAPHTSYLNYSQKHYLTLACTEKKPSLLKHHLQQWTTCDEWATT